ncbi:MAG: ATP synthase F1 subunit gamma [Candidatus Palauibacterales bacterium]|jgi:F-type H+-transporting ATPase subunit gamma|nr:ATP synthase F1 subunit gamma [Candidatus Palauibacterales bacterium]MDP2483934.1 ATP synthase F1 subunit gamma [Candidatus Palauibacterales bacterium]
MAKARDIGRRMRSVESTRKITRTMEMVATSKLRRAQLRVRQARPFAERVAAVVENLVTPELTDLEPLLRQPGRIRRAAVILVTSNRGLCGAFNVNLMRKARELLAELQASDVDAEFHVIGKKGISYFRFRNVAMASTRTDIGDDPSPDMARGLIDPLADRFVREELDAVYVVHAEFRSVMSTPPITRRLLPVYVPQERPTREPYYILDPSADEILARLLPLHLVSSMYRALVENVAAEQGARRTAMKSATDNADEFLTTLRRQFNRARQQEITSQLAEIIGGAEALKG